MHHYFQDRAPNSRHACVLALRAGSGMQCRRRGSVRPEQPERTVTMSFSIGPTESQRQYRAPSSRHTAADPNRHQLRPPAAGCPGEREGLWHRRTLFWRTSSGVQVVSPRAGASLVFWVWFDQTARTQTLLEYCVVFLGSTTEGWRRTNRQKFTFISAFTYNDGVHPVCKTTCVSDVIHHNK